MIPVREMATLPVYYGNRCHSWLIEVKVVCDTIEIKKIVSLVTFQL